MPPHTALRSRSFHQLLLEPYVCTSCLSKQKGKRSTTQATRRSIAHALTSRPRRRTTGQCLAQLGLTQYSTSNELASATAVNAPSTVPRHLRELHQRLQLLQNKANVYVDLSRLHLGLRSLESGDPKVRIAFLGLGSNGVKSARRLARLLLSDELAEEADWERELLDDGDARSILLKYGEDMEERGVQPANSPLVKELSIQSARLRSWNVEILITGLNANGHGKPDAQGMKEVEEAVLVPSITMPNSSGGRVGFVRYPVHKTLIVADGVDGAISLGRLPASLADGNMVNAAVDIPLLHKVGANEPGTQTVSLDLAEPALTALRKDYRANGALYSSQWLDSNVPSVASWLSASSSHDQQLGLRRAVKDLLNSILSHSAEAIVKNETAVDSASDKVSAIQRTDLQSAVSSWSEEAHRDLQLNLNAALASSTWRRTSWSRLFWRIDEVSMSASDVLRRGWLVDAEQSLAFISGRILQSGLASEEDLRQGVEKCTKEANLLPGVAKEDLDKYKAANAPDAPPQEFQSLENLMEFPLAVARMKDESGLDVFFDPPWPHTIHLAREQMLHQLVPSMHRKAQALLLTSLSTIGGSGAFAGWLWIASGGVALYEAGAIAAFGLAWALRRLQKKWSKERENFSQTAREDARRALAEVEGKLRRLINEGGKVQTRQEDELEWREAHASIEACRKALQEAACMGQPKST